MMPPDKTPDRPNRGPRSPAQVIINTVQATGWPTPIGVEVGVSTGKTSRALLIGLPTLYLYMIDSWTTYPPTDQYRASGDGHARLTQEQQDEHKLQANSNTSFAPQRRAIVPMASVPASLTFGDYSIDFVMIDGDHTRVIDDLRAWYPKVRPGGVVFLHDYGHPRDRRGLWTVTRDTKAFCEEIGVKHEVEGDLAWFVKPGV